MATQQQVEAQINAAFQAWRDANLVGVPISWENDGFNPKVADKSVGFLRITTQFAGGSIASLGNRHFRDLGTIIIQTFADLDDGKARSNLLAESCKNFLRTLPTGAAGIRVTNPGVITVGPDGVWYQQNATATIQFDSFV